MLKKIGRFVRRKLLKVEQIRCAVENYKARKAEERYHQRWANRMSTGYTIRNLKPEKLRPYETHAVVTDEGLSVEYMNGRVVGHEHVVPVFIDSTNWGVGKNSKDLKSCGSNDDCGGANGAEKRDSSSDTRTYAGIGPCSSDFG